MSNKTVQLIFFSLLLLAVVYFPLFLHLDSYSLFRYDEGRNAVHAFEMLERNNFILRYFEGQPDDWETKPPVFIWFQALCLKIFGANELAIRLPAALAALATLAFLFRFCKKHLQDSLAAVLSILFLVTTPGYVGFHVSRTGDHDALLILFLLIGLFHYYLYTQHRKQIRHWYICVLALSLGVLTKSIAGLFFLPAYLLWSLRSRHFWPLLKSKHLYLGVGLFFLLVGGYYVWNESLNPGYIELVWRNELFPRYFDTAGMVDHRALTDRLYYWRHLYRTGYPYYLWFLPFALFLIHRKAAPEQWPFFRLLLSTSILYFLLISLGTKNLWYVAPLYPLFAILNAKGLAILLRELLDAFAIGRHRQWVLLLCLIGIFHAPYFYVLKHNVYFFSANVEKYGEALAHLEATHPEEKSFSVLYEWHNASYLFYQRVYNRTKGYQIRDCGIKKDIEECPWQARAGDKVLICAPDLIQQFEQRYNSRLVEEIESCRWLEVVK
ncbi:MAG: glycosyltransferase family 39 protein [Bacteroidota bacterium]